MIDRGLVSFVGLGPGDPALGTTRAAQRLADADVVVRDEDRADPSVLVELARGGKRVLRLMAGDVLETARAVDEVRAVARSGVGYEIVPGVGAGAAAAAFAGVVGRALRVDAADVGTAVQGEPGSAVVTLVGAAGMPLQRIIVTTAGAAEREAMALGRGSVLVAFGAPEEALRWFERRPLFGKRVLVTRAREQAASAAEVLRDQGAEPLVVPTIEIHPPSDPAPLARALSDLRAGAYRWVAFTSANGVERTWEALAASGADARAFGPVRLAAIGPATARALLTRGLKPDVVAREFRGEGLAAAMVQDIVETDSRGRVLLPRASKARDVLPEVLRAAGCDVDVVAAYETRPPPTLTVNALAGELEAGRVDAVLFTSSSTVDNLCDLLGARAADLLVRTRVASIGPITSETAGLRGLRVDVEAGEFTMRGLVGALARSWA